MKKELMINVMLLKRFLSTINPLSNKKELVSSEVIKRITDETASQRPISYNSRGNCIFIPRSHGFLECCFSTPFRTHKYMF